MEELKRESLVRAFAKAGLEVKFAARQPAFVRVGSEGVFFCSVERKGKKAWFSIWPGAEQNRVEVMDANKEFGQVVLLVHEPARTIRVRQWDPRKKKMVITEQKVSGAKRKFLMGYDERDLFMAQMPAAANCTTVEEAHRCLFNKSVDKDRYIRQGEWFFVPADPEVCKALNGNLAPVLNHRPIDERGRGKPHTCEFRARRLEPGATEPIVYAKGKVTHADHATVFLRDWHRVYRNTEDRGTAGPGGFTNWID